MVFNLLHADEEIIMRFEGDILIPLSEWQSLTQDGFGDSDYEPDPYMDDDYEDSKFGGYEDSRLHRREAKEQSDTEQLTTMTSTTMTSTTAESPTTTSSTASVTTQRVKATHSPTPTVNAKLWPNCRVPYKFDHNLGKALPIISISIVYEDLSLSHTHRYTYKDEIHDGYGDVEECYWLHRV